MKLIEIIITYLGCWVYLLSVILGVVVVLDLIHKPMPIETFWNLFKLGVIAIHSAILFVGIALYPFIKTGIADSVDYLDET